MVFPLATRNASRSARRAFGSVCVITMLLFLPLPGHFSCPATFPIRRESSARRLTNGTERIGRSLDAAPNDACASHFSGGQADKRHLACRPEALLTADDRCVLI